MSLCVVYDRFSLFGIIIMTHKKFSTQFVAILELMFG